MRVRVYCVYIACIFACILRVHCVYIACILRAHGVRQIMYIITFTLYVHLMYIIIHMCALRVHCVRVHGARSHL